MICTPRCGISIPKLCLVCIDILRTRFVIWMPFTRPGTPSNEVHQSGPRSPQGSFCCDAVAHIVGYVCRLQFRGVSLQVQEAAWSHFLCVLYQAVCIPLLAVFLYAMLRRCVHLSNQGTVTVVQVTVVFLLAMHVFSGALWMGGVIKDAVVD